MEATTGTGSLQAEQPRRLSRFVFTLNNYTEEELEQLKTLDVKWLIIGKETGSNGTPHLQGACVIGKQVSFSTLKTWPGLRRAHLERMRGSPGDSHKYCSKQDTEYFEKGSLPTPGKRNDLLNTVQKLREGLGLREIVKDDEMATVVVKYHKGLTIVRSLLQEDRTAPPEVYWLYGPTGVGKTRASIEYAVEVFGHGSFFISSGKLKWFDGYDGQPVAILDDLRSDSADFNYLLRLLDRYSIRVEFKGGSVNWIPKIIFITAPTRPDALFNRQYQEELDQLLRRIKYVIHVTEKDFNGELLKSVIEFAPIRVQNLTYPLPPVLDEEEELSQMEQLEKASKSLGMECSPTSTCSDSDDELDKTIEFITNPDRSGIRMNPDDSELRKRRKVAAVLGCPLYDNDGDLIILRDNVPKKRRKTSMGEIVDLTK